MEINNMFSAIWTGNEFNLRETKIYYDSSTIVKVIGSGLCGTDRHLMGLDSFKGSSFGHEIFAEIIRVGDNINSVGGLEINIGDKVIVTPGVPCMECAICTSYSNHEHMCTSRKSHGFSKYTSNKFFPIGGFSNYIELVDELWVVKVDDNLTFDEVMFAEPLAISTKAVERAIGGSMQEIGVGAGIAMRAAVIGLGPIGCSTIFVLKSIGADVLGFDVNPWKSNLVGDIFNINTVTISENSNEALEEIRSKESLDYDVVIDCSGSPRGLELAIKIVKKHGRVVELGSFAPGTKSFINPADICTKELEVFGSALSPVFTYNKVLRLLKKHKQFDLSRLTTHHLSLSNINNLFDILDQNQFLKIHVDTTR